MKWNTGNERKVTRTILNYKYYSAQASNKIRWSVFCSVPDPVLDHVDYIISRSPESSLFYQRPKEIYEKKYRTDMKKREKNAPFTSVPVPCIRQHIFSTDTPWGIGCGPLRTVINRPPGSAIKIYGSGTLIFQVGGCKPLYKETS